MKAETPNKRPPATSQEKIVFGHVFKPWTDDEVEIVREIASQIVTPQMMAELFPDRTARSVKNILAKVRSRMGLARKFTRLPDTGGLMRLPILEPDDPGYDDGEYRRRCKIAEVADRAFVERLRACG